ncbi:MAG TPA: hypothetical protein VFH45_01690 [Acidimicrobiales bacterium]|nr:hypothetical protein [Acidimicrobiales bacterium]
MKNALDRSRRGLALGLTAATLSIGATGAVAATSLGSRVAPAAFPNFVCVAVAEVHLGVCVGPPIK